MKLCQCRLSPHRASLTAFSRAFREAVRNESAFTPVAHPVAEWRRVDEIAVGRVEGKFEMAR